MCLFFLVLNIDDDFTSLHIVLLFIYVYSFKWVAYTVPTDNLRQFFHQIAIIYKKKLKSRSGYNFQNKICIWQMVALSLYYESISKENHNKHDKSNMHEAPTIGRNHHQNEWNKFETANKTDQIDVQFGMEKCWSAIKIFINYNMATLWHK